VIAALVLVGVLVNALANGGDSKPATRTTTTTGLGPAKRDVKLGPCHYENFAASAPVTITNHTRVTLNSAIAVAFTDGLKPFADATVTTDNLHPGRRVTIQATGLSVLSDPTNLICKIASIRRFT
jgi:hypothetical protein